MKYRSWAIVHLDHLEHNVRAIQASLPSSTRQMAVVKADAYGHGLLEVTGTLGKIGIQAFAVATIEEAIRIRTHLEYPVEEILILGRTPEERFDQLLQFKLTQTVFSEAYLEKIGQYAASQPVHMDVHIKVDTGMNRIGFSHNNIAEIEKVFAYRSLRVRGMFTHLAAADGLKMVDVDFTKRQIRRFDTCLQQLKGYDYGRAHVQNSAGIMNYSELNYDYVRPGVMLFGIPSGDVARTIPLKPVMELKSSITMVKKVKAGEAIGYGQAYVAKQDMMLATVAAGYADGYPRSLSGKGSRVLIQGQFATIVGRVCMDQMMVDVTRIKGVREGDVVTLVGEDGGNNIAMDTLSRLAGTINNELVCQISSRVPRLYRTHSPVLV
ncbi:alanine racemase [Paenibacillus sp. TSA_86.1]|uniref:alanine racemase n=1 Tax=Paenibacillus sp. TSA_86.1 TaxID=3415649 RepID=UPI004046033A